MPSDEQVMQSSFRETLPCNRKTQVMKAWAVMRFRMQGRL